MIKWVLTYDGIPPVSLFSGTEGQGTPVVVNTLTDTLYYLKSNTVVALAGAAGVGTLHVNLEFAEATSY